MKEIYIPVKEAAEIEGILYKTFLKQISQREVKGEISIKKERPNSGGQIRKYIKLSDLSRKAQKAYKALKQIDEPDEETQFLRKDKTTEEPWYLDIDINWYIENYKESYYKAVELSNMLQSIINYSGSDKTDYIIQKAAELDMSQRSLYRYMDKYMEATAWSLKQLQDTGANYDYYKIMSLCRKPKVSNTFPSFTPEVKQLIKRMWLDKSFSQNNGTCQMMYDKMQEISSQNGWKIPSYQSLCRYIIHLKKNEHLDSVKFYVSKGEVEWKNQMQIKALRDTSSLKVLEVVICDEHTFDCWVSMKQPNGKITAVRPVLVACIDARSRAVLGDMICDHANSQIIKQSFVKVLYGTPGGMPKYIYLDNGKDYTSEEMTGEERYPKEKRKERYTGLEEVKKGFYRTIGIEDFHRAEPYEPWEKAEVERFFKTVCDGFTRWFKSYTGTLTGSRTDAKIKKDIKKQLEQGELLTMEEFYEKWNHYLHNVYMKKNHRGLKAMGETYLKPIELFENGERYEKALPPKSFTITALMKSDSARVYNIGIKKFGHVYNAPDLIHYKDRIVNIKYDPDDVSKLLVFDAEDGHNICTAECKELLKFAHGVPQEALIEHRKAQNRHLKQTRELAKEAQKPLDERIEGAAVANRIVGEMMIEGKGTSNKIITLPENKSYREIKKEARKSEYIEKKGKEALEKIRSLG